MITTFDVETSFQVTEEGKLDPSSKNPNNFGPARPIFVKFQENPA